MFVIIGWSESAEPKPRRVLRVIERQCQGLAHQSGRADGEIQPRQMGVREDLADAVTFLPDQPSQSIVILDLARRVGAIAALVLEPLYAHRVARAVGQEARHEEARHARILVCASVKKPSDWGTEKNHLWPLSR